MGDLGWMRRESTQDSFNVFAAYLSPSVRLCVVLHVSIHAHMARQQHGCPLCPQTLMPLGLIVLHLPLSP